PALVALDAACHERSACVDGEDKLCLRLDEIDEWVTQLRTIDNEVDLLDALRDDATPKPPSLRVSIGQKPNWKLDLEDLRNRVRAAGDLLNAARDQVSEACAKRLAVEIRRFTLAAAAERRAAGQLGFHDL